MSATLMSRDERFVALRSDPREREDISLDKISQKMYRSILVIRQTRQPPERDLIHRGI